MVVTHGPTLVQMPGELPQDGLEDYWVASKTRLDVWARFLRRCSDSTLGAWSRNHLAGTLEEIITSEMLTRTWGAVLAAHDEARQDVLAGPIARSVMLGHVEIRNRGLSLMVSGACLPLPDAVRLNRLVERTERWTDLLVGRLLEQADVAGYAHHPERAKDFAGDMRRRRGEPGSRLVWPLLLSSMRTSYREELFPLQPNPELNERVAAAVVSCFKPEVFDPSGLPRPYWLARMLTVTHDTSMILEEAMASALRGSSESLESDRRWQRLRRFGL